MALAKRIASSPGASDEELHHRAAEIIDEPDAEILGKERPVASAVEAQREEFMRDGCAEVSGAPCGFGDEFDWNAMAEEKRCFRLCYRPASVVTRNAALGRAQDGRVCGTLQAFRCNLRQAEPPGASIEPATIPVFSEKRQPNLRSERANIRILVVPCG